jgi:NAD(P)H-hydrate epimerase
MDIRILPEAEKVDMESFSLTRQQVRAVDRKAIEVYGFCGLVLMENAGRGCADCLCQLGIDGRVVICCGKGNNAGDGFVVARHLSLRGHDVQVLIWGYPAELTGDAKTNYEILQKCSVPIEIFHTGYDPVQLVKVLTPGSFSKKGEKRKSLKAAWIVDALLGTGARGEPRPPLDGVIDQLNASGVPILAVDLPSGLDCDTGVPARHTIRAAHTCTFVAAKPGFLVAGAEQYTGAVHVLDIGVPPIVIEEVMKSP